MESVFIKMAFIAVLLVAVTTYIVLLFLFRSLVLPLKAILMNTLSILASYGALVVIFQNGFLHQFLAFTPLGFVEASGPILLFCSLFGLSMDYEVFLLSRIQEAFWQTGDNTRAVALGLQRSGGIITSAAVIVVVVSAWFATADMILVKALGLGMALAVIIDATLVRGLLVPATMRLLGDWNWWLPFALQYPLTDRRNVENLSPLSKPGDSNRTMLGMSSGFAIGIRRRPPTLAEYIRASNLSTDSATEENAQNSPL